MTQGLVSVLSDTPDLGHVFFAKTAGDHVHDSAAKSRHALAGSDHERADDKWETAGPVDAEVHDVIEQSADVLGFFLGDVFPADVGWGLQIDVVGWEAGFFVGFEFHGCGMGWWEMGIPLLLLLGYGGSGLKKAHRERAALAWKPGQAHEKTR